MKIGIPKELKYFEGRVGLIPEACAELVAKGNDVFVEQSAGLLSGYSDGHYLSVGAKVVESAAKLYQQAELIVKVKEPVEQDLKHLRADHTVFCYLHLAANTELAKQLCDIGLTAIAFETMEDRQGLLPLLAPMSEVAGRLSIQVGAHLLHLPQGGRGVLLGGLTGADRGHVVVLGAGVAGGHAAQLAAAMGAEVTVFDLNRNRLDAMYQLGPNVTSHYPYKDTIAAALKRTDLVIGAVLLPARHTPRVVTEDMVKAMPNGSVIIDISVDQGGCVETTRPTNYGSPTYTLHGVTHFAVTNMPGAVPRASSQVLSSAIIPYVMRLAEPDALKQTDLQAAVNIQGGAVVHPVLKQELGYN